MKNNKTKIFIDGEVGTVGLNIRSRLQKQDGLELLQIHPDLRKDISERGKMLNSADFVFLCLPDVEAKRAVSLIENDNVRVIDASTAHRTNAEWDYGFPELSQEQYENIRTSKRVAVPGCYATGFIALVYPLITHKIISHEAMLGCFGISGYSGGGKATISEYEGETRNPELDGARLYALSQSHKHQPEMQKICGLKHTPMFNPIIDDYYSGMLVCVPLMGFDTAQIKDVYKKHYQTNQIQLKDAVDTAFLAANTMSGSDDMELYVFGCEEHDEYGRNKRTLLVARFDNLGKGASGAAVQCFNLMLSGGST